MSVLGRFGRARPTIPATGGASISTPRPTLHHTLTNLGDATIHEPFRIGERKAVIIESPLDHATKLWIVGCYYHVDVDGRCYDLRLDDVLETPKGWSPLFIGSPDLPPGPREIVVPWE